MNTFNQIKIFVGHSFKSEDTKIANKFKSYIESLGFECKTGEESQNTSISKKVIERIKSCDIFIGIFSCDQRIINCEKDLMSLKGVLSFFNDKKFYTTSNWVIQESGFAIGCEKGIIFLVEDGVYGLPNLQADLEYIPFNREYSLEEPFKKLAQMLTKIKEGDKKTCPAKSIEDLIQSAPEKAKEENTDKVDSLDNQIYEGLNIFQKMLDAIFVKKDYQLLLAILETEYKLIAKESEYLSAKAFALRKSQLLGKNDAHQELIQLSENYPENSDILQQLALYYEAMNEFTKAKDLFLKIISLDVTNEAKIEAYNNAYKCLAKDGYYDEAMKQLINVLYNEEFNDNKPLVLSNLAWLAIENNDFEKFFTYADYSLSLEPCNTNLRFKLAYSYAEKGFKKLSLLHYTKLISSSKSEIGLNNIGVLYNEFGMPAKSVKYYEEAIELEETLPMANLAFKYLKEGFVKRAEELLNKANELAIKGVLVHDNIGSVKKEITKITEKENQLEESLLLEADKQSKFKLKYAQAYCSIEKFDDNKFSGLWGTPFGTQIVTIAKNTDKFDFEFKTDIKNDNQYTLVKINGNIVNLTASYNIKITEIDETKPSVRSLLAIGLGNYSSAKYEASGYAIIDADYKTIDILEKDKNNNNIEFGTWKKIENQ